MPEKREIKCRFQCRQIINNYKRIVTHMSIRIRFQRSISSAINAGNTLYSTIPVRFIGSKLQCTMINFMLSLTILQNLNKTTQELRRSCIHKVSVTDAQTHGWVDCIHLVLFLYSCQVAEGDKIQHT